LDRPRAGQPRPTGLAREFSSSEYSKAIAAIVAGEPPSIDSAAGEASPGCLIASPPKARCNPPRYLRRRGLAVTLAESCFAS